MIKHAIITGAAGNLGRAITIALLDAEYSVHAIISHRDNASFISRTGLSVYQADLMSENETSVVIKSVINGIEKIDLVIMTVGGYAPGSLQEVTLMDIEKMYRLNFTTAFNVARAALPYMEKQESGGKLGFIGARPALHPKEAVDSVAYTLSKSLVFRLSEIINESGRGKNISSFVVVPSVIDTPQNRTAMPDADFTKWVTPGEIARQILQYVSSSDPILYNNVLKIYGTS
jgi:NAD(P)-dependent dehydrogenase (short-subunit alcohol dehydrogenase family)